MHTPGRKKRLALLASGSGSNAANFIRYFSGHPGIEVGLIVTDRRGAYVLERAARAGVPHMYIERERWHDEAYICHFFEAHAIDAIVLAGFLMLVPPHLVKQYDGRMVNIHPALLPAFGGKGMFGMHVHRAVITSGAKESGISIHLVNEHYDQGRVLFQASVGVDLFDTPETLATKIHTLEYEHYPRVVEAYLS